MSNENDKIYLTNNGGLEAVLNEEDNTRTVTVEHPSIIVRVDGSTMVQRWVKNYMFEDIGGFEYDITRSKTGKIKDSIVKSLNAEVEEGVDDWLTQYTSTFEGPTEYRLQDGLTMIVPLTKDNLLGIENILASSNEYAQGCAAERVVENVAEDHARTKEAWVDHYQKMFSIEMSDIVDDLGQKDGFSVYFLGSDTPTSESTSLFDRIRSYTPTDSAQKILLGSIVAGTLAIGAIYGAVLSQTSVPENNVAVEPVVKEYTNCDEARTAYGQATSFDEKLRLKPIYNRLCNE